MHDQDAHNMLQDELTSGSRPYVDPPSAKIAPVLVVIAAVVLVLMMASYIIG